MNHLNQNIFNGGRHKFGEGHKFRMGMKILDLSISFDFQQLSPSQYFGVGYKLPHIVLKRSTVGKSGETRNSFYSNPCGAKNVEYLKLLFISLGTPLVALEMDIFKLTKGCFVRKSKKHVTIRLASKICGARCNTDLF